MEKKTNVYGIISLVLSIQAILLSCMPEVSIIIALICLMLCAIGLYLEGYKKGEAIAALCCAVSAITISIISYILQEKYIGRLIDLDKIIRELNYYYF